MVDPNDVLRLVRPHLPLVRDLLKDDSLAQESVDGLIRFIDDLTDETDETDVDSAINLLQRLVAFAAPHSGLVHAIDTGVRAIVAVHKLTGREAVPVIYTQSPDDHPPEIV